MIFNTSYCQTIRLIKMASEYNSRPLVPEVLVDGARWAVIRRRPTFAEMTAREQAPDWI